MAHTQLYPWGYPRSLGALPPEWIVRNSSARGDACEASGETSSEVVRRRRSAVLRVLKAGLSNADSVVIGALSRTDRFSDQCPPTEHG